MGMLGGRREQLGRRCHTVVTATPLLYEMQARGKHLKPISSQYTRRKKPPKPAV